MMRAGVSTVQQTLTVEAAAILGQAVTEASKRGHAQATPLHVAATLLISPSSPLRRACLRTHPHSSQLPQCRALELCFNIALDRLQTTQGPLPSGQPSYSNALVAALKRAQAHQRRGCPEQQQQPLLAVKVELEQLIISILDDPSVSRVMREAGFSSTDVKNHLEEVVSVMASHHSGTHSMSDPIQLPLSCSVMDRMGFRIGGAPSLLGGFTTLPNHLTLSTGPLSQERSDIHLYTRPLYHQSSYINPILLKPGGMLPFAGGGEDTKQVLDVLLRKKKRNPVLLGESVARVDGIIRDVSQLLERRHVPEQLHGVKVVSADLNFMTLMHASKEDLHMRFAELNKSVLTGGVIVNVGNLQWLLQPRSTPGFCPVQHAAHEIKELFARHQECNKLWLIGMATNEVYRSCQALYPVLESQWELQPIHIGALARPCPSARCSTQEAGACGMDSLTLSLLPSDSTTLWLNSLAEEDAEPLNCCSDCRNMYKREALLLQDQEDRNQSESPQSCSSSVETPSKATIDQGTQSTCAPQPVLPLWLQRARPSGFLTATATSTEAKDKALPLSMKLQELKKKWNQSCRSLHSERLPRLSATLERWQHPSATCSPVSGHPSGSRCQEHASSLLRENSTGHGLSTPMVGAYPAYTPRTMASSLAIPSTQNGISDHFLKLTTQRDRVQEDINGCSTSGIGLQWQSPSAATPMMRNTEAEAPCSPFDNAIRGQPPRMFLHMDPETLGHLCKGLRKKVGWQPRIISSIANTVMQCRSGLGKRSLKGDTWLVFLGYDRPGKWLMAQALAELIFGEGSKPICLTFGNQQQDVSSPATWSLGLTTPSRGKMSLDQLADAMRHNRSSLFYLEDVEKADTVFQSSLSQALSKGRLVDSSGRDISVNSAIIVMTSSAGTECSGANKCMGAESEAVKGFISEEISRLQSGGKDSACGVGNGQLDISPQQWLGSKRKGVWSLTDKTTDKEFGILKKKANLGLSLDLDLNMASEDYDNGSFPAPHGPSVKSSTVNGVINLELGEEEVLSGARKQLGELCDLVDAAVVFAMPQ